MNTNRNAPNQNSDVPENSISVYGGQDDALNDFPVLKAFQKYVDSEQAKARKRMLVLSAFFAFLMFVVIAVFVILLVSSSTRNQALNDRLVEYAMKDRDIQSRSSVTQPAPIVQPVVQPVVQQDNSALFALTAKIDEMQKKLAESQAKAEKAAAEAVAKAERAAIEAAKPKEPTKEELEIKRLQELLAAERAKAAAEQEKIKAAAEKEKQHQAEIEAYRRKHYPELYEQQDDDEEDDVIIRPRRKKGLAPKKKQSVELEDDALDDEFEDADGLEVVVPQRKGSRPAPKVTADDESDDDELAEKGATFRPQRKSPSNSPAATESKSNVGAEAVDAKKTPVTARRQSKKGPSDDAIDALLKEISSIRYFDEEEGEKKDGETDSDEQRSVPPQEIAVSTVKAETLREAASPAVAPAVTHEENVEPQQSTDAPPSPNQNSEQRETIPVDIKGTSSDWSIPLD